MKWIELTLKYNKDNQIPIGCRYTCIEKSETFQSVKVSFIKPNPELNLIWRYLTSISCHNTVDNSFANSSQGMCECKIGMIFDSNSKQIDDSIYISSANFMFNDQSEISEEMLLYLSIKFDTTYRIIEI